MLKSALLDKCCTGRIALEEPSPWAPRRDEWRNCELPLCESLHAPNGGLDEVPRAERDRAIFARSSEAKTHTRFLITSVARWIMQNQTMTGPTAS
jgi:hypothetical protein